jgi:hypothetical protein
MPPAIRSGVPAGLVDDGGAVEGGAEDTEAGDVGVPLVDGVLLWCEFATVAMPTVAPAIATTLSAARAGAQRRPPLEAPPKENPRRGCGSRPRLRSEPCDSLATR